MEKNVILEFDCVRLNLKLAESHMSKKNLELAAYRITDARKSLEELAILIKKAN